jgi:Uma2 family endonuclease
MAIDTVISSHGGEILATGVTFEEYLVRFAGMHCELVDGNVIKMSPVSLTHQNSLGYIHALLGWYFEYRQIGCVILQPFVQRLKNVESKREPDLLVILRPNFERIKETYLDGAADICIEIASPGTEDVDRGDKFIEYEKGGVGEYWLFDPRRSEALFYRLNAEGLYVPQQVDVQGNYRTPLLPDFVLHVPTLWLTPLPSLSVILNTVQDMLK